MTKPMIPAAAPAICSGLGVAVCLAKAARAPANMAAASTMKIKTSTRYQIAERPMNRSGFDRYTEKVRSRTSPSPRGRSIGVCTACTSAHPTDAVQMACVLGGRLREADSPLQSRQRPWRPPVEIAEEAHRRRHDESAHQRGVDRHGEGHAKPDRLDEDDVGKRERREH